MLHFKNCAVVLTHCNTEVLLRAEKIMSASALGSNMSGSNVSGQFFDLPVLCLSSSSARTLSLIACLEVLFHEEETAV